MAIFSEVFFLRIYYKDEQANEQISLLHHAF